jgi:hypothetical protein
VRLWIRIRRREEVVSKELTVEWVEVTPELAEKWLAKNTHNRNQRVGAVANYAYDMLNGNWLRTGDTVKFDLKGNLIDGQHRLAAIVVAGETNPDISVPLLVASGLDPAVQEATDTGVIRRLSDALRLRGHVSSFELAATLRVLTLWEQGFRRQQGGGRQQVTRSQCFATLAKYPDLPDEVREAQRISHKVGAPVSVLGLCYHLFSELDPDGARDFFEKLGSGENMAAEDPIYELRKAYRNSRDNRGERNRTYLMAITIKAWNAYQDGEKVKLLSFRTGGASPERFPEPH